MQLRRLVLDVVKPLEPSIVDFAKAIAQIEGVAGVNVSVIEIDRKVENVKITIEGKIENEEEIFETIRKLGGAVHSIDEVAAGKKLVEHVLTVEEM